MLRTVVLTAATSCLGALRYGLTLALFCGIWWYDARYLNWAFDANLTAIKVATGVADGSGKAEAMLRAFSAEKMLLFGEASAVVWAIGRTAVAAIRWLVGDTAGEPSQPPRKTVSSDARRWRI